MGSVHDIPEARSFILHWGEMGTHWGVNRSVAQMHALLYLSDRPLHAEEIASTLGLARSNVSNGLKELQGYGIVRRTHLEGDRRDHFLAENDVWTLFTRITAERKKREIDPTIAHLAQLDGELRGRQDVPAHLAERIGAMHGVLDQLSGWYVEVEALPRSTLLRLLNLGAKIARFIPGKGRD